VINGLARSEQTYPGEISSMLKLAQIAARAIESQRGFEVDRLDLSHLASRPTESGRIRRAASRSRAHTDIIAACLA